MSKFSDRVFGTNVDPDVLKIFNNLQNGSFEQNPNEPIVENKDYLGDRTTFARMWTASIISGSVTDPETEETRQEVEVNFHIVNDNRGESYEPNKPIGDVVNTELSDNSYLKPKAGITSINTKNEGALGVIKNTTVEFVVHNKKDFESIFLPFFMKPGATVIVDYGWSDSFIDLYDVEKKVKNTDVELSEFKKFIYGSLDLNDVQREKINAVYQDLKGEYYYLDVNNQKQFLKYNKGFLEDNAGLVDTIIGTVKNFNATVNQQGSFTCTIDLVSQNTTLLDQEITDENNLKFIFANHIEDTIITILTGNDKTVNAKLKTLNDNFSAKQKREAINNFFEDTLNVDQEEGANLGVLPKKAIELGFFYQNLTSYSGVNTTNNRDLLYMSFGRFEDLFLNNLIAKTTTKKTDVTRRQTIGKLDTSFNFRNVWIRFNDNLYFRQKQQIESNEALPVFLYPNNWTNTYSTGKRKASESTHTEERLFFKVNGDLFEDISDITDQSKKELALSDSDLLFDRETFSYRVKESSGKRLFTIDIHSWSKLYGFEENNPPTVNDIIDLLSSARTDESSLRSFTPYTTYKLSKADVPTADEIIAANKNDLLAVGANADTSLENGKTYAIIFKIPIPESEQRSVEVTYDKSINNDWRTKVIPLRELFISVEEISKAFSTKQNVNDAIDYLLERINKDSFDVLKLKMYSPNTVHSSLSIVDANLMPVQNLTDEMLVFDVTSDKSIVSDFSYNFTTPKGGFASMIAIGDKTSTKLFDEQTKDTLNFLKVLEVNKFTENPNKVYYKSLPLNTRDETKRTTEVEFDFESIAAYDVQKIASGTEGRRALVDNFTSIVDDIKTEAKKKNKTKKQKSNTSLEKQNKDDGDSFLFGDTDREYYGKLARLELIYSSEDNSVSPILPIELGLTVYGNTYLNNGDIFNINFLPTAYLKRVYFQIVGVEQKLTPSGWTTSYSTLMRVNPTSKKEAVDEDRKMSFSKVFIKTKLREYDEQFVYNLMNVVESSVPLNNLPNGYTGYQINTDYSIYKKGQLKAYDNENKKDSRVLQNYFTPASNSTDFLYIYAMTKTIYSFIKDRIETIFDDENKLGLEFPKKFKVEQGLLGISNHRMHLGIAIEDEKPDIFGQNQTPQDILLIPEKIINEESALQIRKRFRKNIINEFTQFAILDGIDRNYITKYGFAVPNNSNINYADEQGALIRDFTFKLNDYDNGKASFYLIKTPHNITCINSLRIPKWFANPTDFIKSLNLTYKELLKQKNSVDEVLNQTYKTTPTEIGGVTYSALR